ncbi:hypothetical protein BpHYR1_027134 [Brachionus plicatilis]|uniref:Uncharacterized protein n=1 Tax=Brachionus plicatilis TaxID=10195 RepID=A0A3M7RK93_BRAPC|nr:hypothetical protein BpHYR1_027134 [Brachionus plicatilis]
MLLNRVSAGDSKKVCVHEKSFDLKVSTSLDSYLCPDLRCESSLRAMMLNKRSLPFGTCL